LNHFSFLQNAKKKMIQLFPYIFHDVRLLLRKIGW